MGTRAAMKKATILLTDVSVTPVPVRRRHSPVRSCQDKAEWGAGQEPHSSCLWPCSKRSNSRSSPQPLPHKHYGHPCSQVRKRGTERLITSPKSLKPRGSEALSSTAWDEPRQEDEASPGEGCQVEPL